MSKVIVTPEGVLSFPNLFKAEQVMGQGDPKFTATLLLPPDADLSSIKEAIQEAITEKFGADAPKNLRMPVRKAGEVDSTPEEYADWWMIRTSAQEKHPPQVVDAQRQPMLNAGDAYAGCKVVMGIRFYGYAHASGKGIGAGLQAVMKTGEGEPLGGGRVNVDSLFGGVQVDTTQAPQAPESSGFKF